MAINKSKGWIGVDLDRTLARYEKWVGPDHIGDPIPEMVERIKGWLAEGIEVRIFTARVSHDGSSTSIYEAMKAEIAITEYCAKHIGQPLMVTNQKDYATIQIWDDIAVRVVPNTGKPCCEL